jgi:hypothetical protein
MARERARKRKPRRGTRPCPVNLQLVGGSRQNVFCLNPALPQFSFQGGFIRVPLCLKSVLLIHHSGHAMQFKRAELGCDELSVPSHLVPFVTWSRGSRRQGVPSHLAFIGISVKTKTLFSLCSGLLTNQTWHMANLSPSLADPPCNHPGSGCVFHLLYGA